MTPIGSTRLGWASGCEGGALVERGAVLYVLEVTERESFTSTDSEGNAHEFVLSATWCAALIYRSSEGARRLEIEVATTDEGLCDGYSAAFEEVRPGVWRPVLVTNRWMADYSGKGITASVYRWVAARTGGVVQSSTRDGNDGWDCRTGFADRVWRRLEAQGEAVYDAGEDRFYHPRKPE